MIFLAKTPPEVINPCIPSPCGSNSECRVMDQRAVCSCVSGMYGAPPNCRPECIIHEDCPSNRACIRQKCEDPCIGACGFNAVCSTQKHKPICSCLERHEGDPYAGCNIREGMFRHIRLESLFETSYFCKIFLPYLFVYCNVHIVN